ncbi:hypothetical protein PAMA_007349 [Pampus argenteus]
MKAVSPALCAARSRRSTRCLLPSFSQNKSPAAAEEPSRVPVLLLRDMDLCYRLLRQLVPSLPAGRVVSRVEILQHAIDYILDLQTELESSYPAGDRGEQWGEQLHCGRQQQRLQRPQSDQSPGSNILTCSSNDFLKKEDEEMN